MADKFVFSMWTYNGIDEFTPDEVDVWADCGLNVPMAPATTPENASALIPFLDRARERGIKLIGNFTGMSYGHIINIGEEEYERRVRLIVDAIGDHPALYGLCVGDEPGTYPQMEACKRCLEINKKVAPHLVPYLNYRGGSAYPHDADLGGRNIGEWLKYVSDSVGPVDVCYDDYSPAINERSKGSFMRTISRWVEGSKTAGCDCWGCFLSSAHHVYHKQTEIDVLWQINAAATLGLRGVLWFRFYDKIGVYHYKDSPIDEFGNKTELYYGLMRAQRRFSHHFGELMMKLDIKKTYQVNSDRGVFPEFRPGDHDLIRSISANDETIISFFEDDRGDEYVILFHTVTEYYGAVKVECDADRCSLYYVRDNGKSLTPVGIEAEDAEEMIILPASIEVLKIVKK